MNKVYAFQFNDCIYESTYATMSLHRTKKGAYLAMRKYLLEEWNKTLEKHHNWEKWEYFRNDHPFENIGYCVTEILVEE